VLVEGISPKSYIETGYGVLVFKGVPERMDAMVLLLDPPP